MSENDLNIETAINEEIGISTEAKNAMDNSRDEWIDDIQSEKQLREYDQPTEEEQELTNRITQLIVEGLAGKLDDKSDLLEALEALEEAKTKRAKQRQAHLGVTEQTQLSQKE